jgi:hypothetical protein
LNCFITIIPVFVGTETTMLTTITRIKQSVLLIALLASGLLAKPMVPDRVIRVNQPISPSIGELEVRYPGRDPIYAPDDNLLKTFKHKNTEVFKGVILANHHGTVKIHMYGLSDRSAHFAIWVPGDRTWYQGHVRAGTPVVLDGPTQTHHGNVGPQLHFIKFDDGADNAGPSNQRQAVLDDDGGPDSPASSDSTTFSDIQHQLKWK